MKNHLADIAIVTGFIVMSLMFFVFFFYLSICFFKSLWNEPDRKLDIFDTFMPLFGRLQVRRLFLRSLIYYSALTVLCIFNSVDNISQVKLIFAHFPIYLSSTVIFSILFMMLAFISGNEIQNQINLLQRQDIIEEVKAGNLVYSPADFIENPRYHFLSSSRSALIKERKKRVRIYYRSANLGDSGYVLFLKRKKLMFLSIHAFITESELEGLKVAYQTKTS